MKHHAHPTAQLNPAKTGVLITNLGTPNAPDTPSLRAYLSQFLSDPRVVEIPRLVWLIILHGIILRTRPKKSAQAYQSIWTERGSPLKYFTEDQALALSERLGSDQIIVDYAMRYGQPSIEKGIDSLIAQGCTRLLVLPLYPQYASSTTGSTFDAVAQDFTKRRAIPDLRFVSGYHDFQPYIDALAQNIKTHWQQKGQAEKLVLSYHGLPAYTHKKGDPYYLQCLQTSKLLAAELGICDDEYITVFQSRFGKAEWLKPYTDQTLKELGKSGIKSVQVVCPGFAADCLETIEEIGVENRDYFLEAGGEQFEYIPALNASEAHIDMLTQLIQKHLQGWGVETK